MTFHVSKIARDPAPNLLFAPNSGGFTGEAHTATIPHRGNRIGYERVASGRLTPPEWRQLRVAPAPDLANRKLTFPKNQLSQFDVFPDDYLNGASLRAYRVSGGKLIEVGETTITDTVVKQLEIRHDPARMVAAGTGSYVWAKPKDSKPGMVLYCAVAAVNAAGERGPWSAPVAFTFGTANAQSPRTATNLVAAPKSYANQTLNAALPVPAGLTATGLDGDLAMQLSWTPIAGMGTVVAYSYHPDMVADEHVIVADISFIQQGDLLIWSKKFDHTATKAQALSQRVWNVGGEFIKFGASGVGFFNETMPNGVTYAFMNEGGKAFIRLNIPAGVTYQVTAVTHSGTAQQYYRVLSPSSTYTIRLRARASTAVSVPFSVSGLGVSNVNRPIGTSWGEVSVNFSPDKVLTDALPRPTYFTITAPATAAVSFDIEMFHIGDAGTEPFMATPEYIQTLVDSGAGFIRDHALIKTQPVSYGMEDVLQLTGPMTHGGNSVPQLLSILKAARAANGGKGLNPWLQIEAHCSDAEYRMLGGYLCTVYDAAAPESPEKRGAALRVAQGQIAPWQTEFDSLIVECGNEHWQNGSLPEFYSLPNIATATAAELNGHLLDRLAEGIVAAPGCDREKFRFYLGGWPTFMGWNTQGMAVSRHADLVGYADYNGGWDSGLQSALDADDPAAWFNTLANSSVVVLGARRGDRMAALAEACAAASAGRARPIVPMHYEAGPGYALPGGLTAAQDLSQNKLMKSVGSGTAMLDAFLLNTVRGVLSSNFFLISPSKYWGHAAQTKDGGAYNPPFQWFCFMNRHLVGQTRLLDPLTAEPLNDPAGTRQGNALRIYQVNRADGRRAIVAVNLDPATAHPVKLRLKSTRRWTRHWMSGDMKTYNFTLDSKDSVSIRSEQMPVGWGASQIEASVPPGMVEVFIEDAA